MMGDGGGTRWFTGRRGDPQASVRLFCIAHAGGGGSFFLPWQRALGPEVEVWPVVLPGREARLRERPHERMEDVLGPLHEAVRAHTDRPWALFGHSMGAVVAYELARACTADGGLEPAHLFVSARRAPHLPARRPSLSALPDEVFLRAVTALNGTPADVLAQPDLVAMFLPCIRADFALNDGYVPLPGPRLRCPVSASVGRLDPEARGEELDAWAHVTSGAFRPRSFDGDHFYLKDGRDELLAVIRSDLAPVMGLRHKAAPEPVPYATLASAG